MIVESLEPRRFRSVTVTEGYPGFYEVTGDGADDVINISVNMADQTFTLDGTTYPNVSYIFVNGGAGNDEITVQSVDGSGMIGAGIQGGKGDDKITLNFDGGIWGGKGNDELHLSDAYRGEIYGEEGDDRLFISGACADAEIRGGDGADLIDCSANFYGLVLFGGEGNDTMIGTEQADQFYGEGGHDTMTGNAGDDTFYLRDGETDDVDGGDGYDFAYCDTDECFIIFTEEFYF